VTRWDQRGGEPRLALVFLAAFFSFPLQSCDGQPSRSPRL